MDFEGAEKVNTIQCLSIERAGFLMYSITIFDGIVRSPIPVIPDLIRDPEVLEFTGFRLSPE